MIIQNNKVIDVSLETILKKIRQDTGYRYFKDIRVKADDYLITCPFHKNGNENNPSMSIHCLDDEVGFGVYHCFTCGENGDIFTLIQHCFDCDKNSAIDWLLNNFEYHLYSSADYLPEINLESKEKIEYINESILDSYSHYHPYMDQRKLNKEIIEKFKVRYDSSKECLLFPVWDINNNLVMITERSVKYKRFNIPSNVEKPVYLLNFIKKESITKVHVCESQINALTLWGWGHPSIALFGTGSKKQYEILNKSGIREYVLCFDGDNAGDEAIKRFKKNIRKDVFVGVKKIPRDQDVNDLSKEIFDNLETENI